MPFIGNQPALSYTSFAKQDFTTSATTSYTLDNPVANANELALFINFVRQEPTTAYSASGTSLTLTSATSASDDMYCVFLGKAVQTVNPPNGSVGTAQLIDGAVTKAKTSALMYPAFEASVGSDQTVTSSTWTVAACNTVEYDTDSCYDNSTYKFTPTVAGKYLVYGSIYGACSSSNELNRVIASLSKNGSKTVYASIEPNGTSRSNVLTPSVTVVYDLNGSTDYVELQGFVQISAGTALMSGASIQQTYFGAYRIGD